ncbi:MAG: hypothetical protein EHM58_03060 [Ignavibacteriae bacterium]|nr:MAG: hypothetical protein EHM58_03060 [Ignavibacteriota bacterium]
MKEIITKYIIILLLGTTTCVLSSSEFFHHHDNVNDESRCQVCFFTHSVRSDAVEYNKFESLHLQFDKLFVSFETIIIPQDYSNLLSSRAPPLS